MAQILSKEQKKEIIIEVGKKVLYTTILCLLFIGILTWMYFISLSFINESSSLLSTQLIGMTIMGIITGFALPFMIKLIWTET